MTTQSLALPDEQETRDAIEAINRFQAIVKSQLIEGQDYGIIPGTDKPTLLKPGAEKISKLLGLSDTYEIVDKIEDWKQPLFHYQVKCTLTLANGRVISEGLGECNSMEAKYRWRESKRKCPQCSAEAIIKGKQEYGGGWLCFKKQGGCGAKFEENDPKIQGQTVGRVENEDIFTQVNTLLKMAKKRALVDASLSAGRLSNIFTQDMEDIVDTPPKQEAKQGGNGQTIAEPQKKQADPNAPITDPQVKAIGAILTKYGIDDDLERHKKVSEILGLTEVVTSMRKLTKQQASTVIEKLGAETK